MFTFFCNFILDSQFCCQDLKIYKSIPLACEFIKIEGEYSCKSTSLIVTHPHMTINEVRGNHPASFFDNSSVKRLQIIDAIFKFFTNDIFASFKSIETLDIINSQLSNFTDPKIKSGKLKTLRIEGNSIENLEDEAFVGVENLEILILAGNNIKIIQPTAFSELFHLQKLDLKNNKISSLHQNVFNDLRALTHISLSNNDLSYLQGNLLAHQKHLQMVNFNGNPIISIGNEFLNYAMNLQHVDFAGTCVGEFTYKGIDETKLRIKQFCKYSN